MNLRIWESDGWIRGLTTLILSSTGTWYDPSDYGESTVYVNCGVNSRPAAWHPYQLWPLRMQSVEPEIREKPFQFSLRTLLIGMCLVALGAAMLFSLPAELNRFLLKLSVAGWLAALVTVVVYGNGERRTFAIGAIVPAALAYYDLMTSRFLSPFFAVLGAAASLGVGYLCVHVRRWLEQH